MKVLGLEAVRLLRSLVYDVSLPSPQENALKALLHCYEASLFRALDFHDLMDLQSHHIVSERTLALLDSLRAYLPCKELQNVMQTIEMSDSGCAVAGTEHAPPKPSHKHWNQRMLQAVDRLNTVPVAWIEQIV